jgi:hypothetical protein
VLLVLRLKLVDKPHSAAAGEGRLLLLPLLLVMRRPRGLKDWEGAVLKREGGRW